MLPTGRQLDGEIATLAQRVPAHLHTLPGANDHSVVSLFGETDPITTFTTPAQLVAFPLGVDGDLLQPLVEDANNAPIPTWCINTPPI